MNPGHVRSSRVAFGPLNYSLLAGTLENEIIYRESLQQPEIPQDKSLFNRDFKVFDFDILKSEGNGIHNIKERNGRKEWILSIDDIHCIALGASITGTGGGGSTYIVLKALEHLFSIRPDLELRLVNPDELTENDGITYIGLMGAPLVELEKLVSGGEVLSGVNMLQKLYSNSPTTLYGCIEIGGSNAIIPLIVGALNNTPVLDSDGMGRAFPKLNLFLPFLKGISPYPVIISDEKGATLMVCSVPDTLDSNGKCAFVEEILRENCEKMGCLTGCAFGPILKDNIKVGLVKYSYSRAWRIGKAIMNGRMKKVDPMIALKQIENATEIFCGNIEYHSITTQGGFNFGRCVIGGQITQNSFKGKKALICFQNEYLIATQYENDQDLKEEKNGKLLGVVPDLITLVDHETFEPIMTSDIKYGMIIRVILIPSVKDYIEEDILKSAGPRAFGYDIDFVSCAKFVEKGSEIPSM